MHELIRRAARSRSAILFLRLSFALLCTKKDEFCLHGKLRHFSLAGSAAAYARAGRRPRRRADDWTTAGHRESAALGDWSRGVVSGVLGVTTSVRAGADPRQRRCAL